MLKLLAILFLFANSLVVAIKTVPTDNARNKVHINYIYLSSPSIQIGKVTNDVIIGVKNDKDKLLLREIFINKLNNTKQYIKISSEGNYHYSNVRLMNVGREVTYCFDYKMTQIGKKKSNVEAECYIEANDEVRLWIEIYGNNHGSKLSYSWIFVISSLYLLFNN